MTKDQKIALLLFGGIAIAALMSIGGIAVYAWESELNAEEAANAKKWLPTITAAEQQYGIPPGLLARQALEESAYRTSIIDGTQASSAGALGILQLEPAYFTSVQVPIPFTDGDVMGQIAQAAGYMHQLYSEFGNWGYALAAYNAGPGAIQNVLNGTQTLPSQTQNYVSQILADVPVAGASIPA